jgi:hypothetical protein
LALHPIHNLWLTDLVTTGEIGSGTTLFFLPSFGMSIWAGVSIWFLYDNWKWVKEQGGWGEKKVFIPLLVIVAAIAMSGVTAPTLQGKVGGLLMGLALFALYAAVRVMGKEVFRPLAVGAAIASVGVILFAVMHPGSRSGGFVFEENYDVVVGYVLLGTAMYLVHMGRWKWPLVGLALVAMFLTGSPEAVVALVVIGVAVLVRRDWSWKLVWVVVPMVLVGAVYFGLGYGQEAYGYTQHIASNDPVLSFLDRDKAGVEVVVPADETILSKRWRLITDAVRDMRPLGEGYSISVFKENTVHNVPMVIVQQLGWPGVVAGIAWLWLVVWGVVKTKWKYVFILVAALAVFDHYVFTQLAPWFPAVVGGASVATGSDLLFREEKSNEASTHETGRLDVETA